MFYALLLPIGTWAQCDQTEWIGHLTAISPTVTALSSSIINTVHSKTDGSWYWINGLGGQTVNEVSVNGEVIQCEPCQTGKSIMLQRYDSEGELIWSKFGCFGQELSVRGMSVDNEGNLIFGGYYRGDLSFDGMFLGQSEMGFPSHYTMKVSSSGELLWFRDGNKSAAVLHTSVNQGSLLFLSVVDSTSFDGVTYYHSDSISSQSNQAIILLVDEDGHAIWHQRIGGNGNRSLTNISCSTSSCVIQGNFMDEIVYQGNTLSGGNNGKMFQLSIDPETGEFRWMKKQSNNVTSVIVESSTIISDSVLFSGGIYNGNSNPSEFTFLGTTILSSNGLPDGFIMKQNLNNGQLRWLKTLGAAGYSSVHCMDETASGVVIGGFYTSEELNFEGLTVPNHSENEDPFVLVLDQDGKPTCHLTDIGSTARELAHNIWVFEDYQYLTANFVDSLRLGQYHIETNANSQAVWKTCLPCDTLTGIKETSRTQDVALEIYPNPTTTQTKLTYRTPQGKPALQLTDMLGSLVQTVPLPSNEGIYTLDASSLGTGVYFCTLLSGAEVLATQKLSVIKN
jgi:hypothetical protein